MRRSAENPLPGSRFPGEPNQADERQAAHGHERRRGGKAWEREGGGGIPPPGPVAIPSAQDRLGDGFLSPASWPAMPESSNGGRSGNRAMSERVPPIASTVWAQRGQQHVAALLQP